MATVLQLRQEIQQQLMLANQLLHLIQSEVREIKNFTSVGGPFEDQITKSATLIDQLERVRHVTVEPAAGRPTVHMNNSGEHTIMSYEQHDTFRDHSL